MTDDEGLKCKEKAGLFVRADFRSPLAPPHRIPKCVSDSAVIGGAVIPSDVIYLPHTIEPSSRAVSGADTKYMGFFKKDSQYSRLKSKH